MKLDNLFLKKEEFPILNGSCFQIPVHPKLLTPRLSIDTTFAENFFDKLVGGWVEDKELIKYYKENSLNINLEKKPRWHCLTREEENRLVSYFSINRDFGGGIHFNKGEFNCLSVIPNQ